MSVLGIIASDNRLSYALRIVLSCVILTPAISFAQEASLPSAPPQLTLLDPVPTLLKGSAVTTNLNTLATKGRLVEGTAADSASELVLRVPANSVGEQFTITVMNDQGVQSTSPIEDGGLGSIGTKTFTASQLTVTAVTTTVGAMAFAIYGSPLDFPRPDRHTPLELAAQGFELGSLLLQIVENPGECAGEGCNLVAPLRHVDARRFVAPHGGHRLRQASQAPRKLPGPPGSQQRGPRAEAERDPENSQRQGIGSLVDALIGFAQLDLPAQ